LDKTLNQLGEKIVPIDHFSRILQRTASPGAMVNVEDELGLCGCYALIFLTDKIMKKLTPFLCPYPSRILRGKWRCYQTLNPSFLEI